eukprot:TRINITY_DN9636_c0_g1_i1.p1 TRINITY_DN9636_c0_g1~~TRINITY_DN9636_c0_g1_i1.p1  ORF type:complete len:1059 (-),score=203.64 TRINITY_DN9636_c0_g1_i1:39-3215(-)
MNFSLTAGVNEPYAAILDDTDHSGLSPTNQSEEPRRRRRAVLKVGGMFCSNCSTAVTRALEKEAAVEKCEVALVSEQATVWYTRQPGEEAPSASDLCEVIETIGFDASVLRDEEVRGPRQQDASNAGSSRKPSDNNASLYLAAAADSDGLGTDWVSHLESLDGVFSVVARGGSCRWRVTYDPTVVGARSILKAANTVLQSKGPSESLFVDPLGDSCDAGDSDDCILSGLGTSLSCTALICTVCWILPCFEHCTSVLKFELFPGIEVMTLTVGLLATPVQLLCARRFHIGAYHAIKSGIWDMNVLISLGTGLTFGYSWIVLMVSAVNSTLLAHGHHCKSPPTAYFESPCMIISVILIGKSLESWAKKCTAGALQDLLSLKPRVAYLLREREGSASMCESSGQQPNRATKAECIPSDLVEIGDVLQVFPGDAAPADGTMVAEGGDAEFDESLLTGESRPVTKAAGDFIIGGSTCVTGRAELRVERLGSSTTLSQMTSLVESAQLSKAPVQQVADAVAHCFVPFVVALALMTWLAWGFLVYYLQWVQIGDILAGHPSEWPEMDRFFFVLEHGLTVLLVACPCALGLATPTAVMTATGAAAKQGILVRNGAVPLELGSKVTHVVLDKTGTLTSGKPRVVHVAASCPIGVGKAAGQLASPAWDKLLTEFRKADSGAKQPARLGNAAPLRCSARTAWLQHASAVVQRNQAKRPDVSGAAVASPTASPEEPEDEFLTRPVLRAEAERAIWWAVGSAEMSSEHPLAKQLVPAAEQMAGHCLRTPTEFQNIAGVGVRCKVAGLDVQVSAAQRLHFPSASSSAHASPTSAKSALQAWSEARAAEGNTVVALCVEGEPLAVLTMRDKLSETAHACLRELRRHQVDVWMCTGDHRNAALAVAKECGIAPSRVVAEALPVDKVALIHRLKTASPCATANKKALVAMVGDGVNDAPALASADVGIAIAAGHDVTVNAADVVLVKADLRDLVNFLALSRTTLGTIWRNFAWAFVFNILALPIAAGALWRRGVTLTPPFAVCLMLGSSLLVVLSSLSLRSFKPVLGGGAQDASS